MKLRIAIVTGFVILFSACGLYSQQKAPASSAQQAQIAALKDLRDSGAITAQEYESKLQAIQGPVKTSTAAAPAPVTASAGGTRVEYIKDPTLNDMNAIPVTIPAKWRFQGALFQMGNCVREPFSVWRATSPDGLSFFENMPTLGWVWGTGPALGSMQKDGCLPLQGAMSAQDFLKYVSSLLQVEYLAAEPVPPEQNAPAQKYARDMEASGKSKWRAELARASVSYKNGTFAMKGLLKVTMYCTEAVSPGVQSVSPWSPGHPASMVTGPPSTVDQCNANVSYLTAAESQFTGMLQQWNVPGMGGQLGLDAWQTAWTQRYVNRVRQQTDATIAASNAQFQAQQVYFRHIAEVQQQMHEQFLATMQAGTDRSMARAAQVANSNHRMAQDWVDYSLDRQTVLDPATGQVSKVSSSYSQTWVNSSGQTFQTNDVNANPNGSLSGNWTKQQVMHGDGAK